MDLEYLLFLQNIRISMNDACTPFLEWLSLFGTTFIYCFPTFLYWCVNKKNGLFVMTSLLISSALNPVIKLTACIYRPWVRDPRIIPAGDAIATAGGYSFPSGHTMIATPVYGGLAVLAKKSGHKIIMSFLIFLILLTGFSRNYLCVHTPQDVLIGFLGGTVSIYISAKIIKYLENNREKENLFLITAFLLGIAALVYINVKDYPVDYVNGKMLVDPAKMKVSGVGDISTVFGFVLGRYIEKKWIKFTPTGLNLKGMILAAIGLVIEMILVFYFKSFMTGILGSFWGRIVYGFVLMFFAMAIYPLVIKLFSKK